ncbi:hypothetical protein AAHE18_17G164700 [Arachis hypogaea]
MWLPLLPKTSNLNLPLCLCAAAALARVSRR